MADQHLDCKGLNCPIPIVNIGKSLKLLKVGELLTAEADDPAFEADVRALIKQLNHTIVSLEHDGQVTRVIIRKER